MGDATDGGGERLSARERLLNAADRLFYLHGINATGVDAVIDAADVARMTFYKHFRGKDGLIAAYLEGRDVRWRASLEEAIAAAGDDATARLLAIFDALKVWASDSRYRGCSFANAAAELSDSDHPARAVVRAHKQAMRERVAELAHATDVADPNSLVDQLLMLSEGAVTTTALGTVDDAIDKARESARHLLAASG